MKIEVPKVIVVLIGLGVVFAGAALLLGQFGELYGKAQGTISGTIVLTDKYTSSGQPSFAGVVSLPGSTCDAFLTLCGNSTDLFFLTWGADSLNAFPAFYKSKNIERDIGWDRWLVNNQRQALREYIPISQPLTFSGGCNSSEYRDVPSGNYILGFVLIGGNENSVHLTEFPPTETAPNNYNGTSGYRGPNGQWITHAEVSYSCT